MAWKPLAPDGTVTYSRNNDGKSAQPWPLPNSELDGQTIVAYGPLLGGYIQNPLLAVDQNVGNAEPIYISLTGQDGPYMPVAPGQTFVLPANLQVNVWAQADTPGHRISGMVAQAPPAYKPATGVFPPETYTTRTAVLGSYLYKQYDDDDDLQAFVDAYNDIAQQYVTWFATVLLPVYTNPNVNSSLLDWVANGLYGQKRPVLPSGLSRAKGPLNTFLLNALTLNGYVPTSETGVYVTDDDLFRRILTWHLWKGDGKLFDVRWLKRRIMRFLTGDNGGPGETATTYPVSVTFGPGPYVANINLQSKRRIATGGAILNVMWLNSYPLNSLETTTISLPFSPLSPVFKAAVDSGVLELPFQFTWNVNVS